MSIDDIKELKASFGLPTPDKRKFSLSPTVESIIKGNLCSKPEFKISTENSGPNHEYGDGGNWISTVRVLKENNPVLIVTHEKPYDTYSDDSTDYWQSQRVRIELKEEFRKEKFLINLYHEIIDYIKLNK